MQYTELLRGMVLLTGGVATGLVAIAALSINAGGDEVLASVAVGWWLVAAIFGVFRGGPQRAAEAVRPLLANSRTATSLPATTGARAFLSRVWPIGVFALIVGALGPFFPQVTAIGTGFAFAVALSWRNREAAVTAIEDRDGVCFYVESNSALEPVKLIRTPGLRREHTEHAQPPPPPPADSER